MSGGSSFEGGDLLSLLHSAILELCVQAAIKAMHRCSEGRNREPSA